MQQVPIEPGERPATHRATITVDFNPLDYLNPGDLPDHASELSPLIMDMIVGDTDWPTPDQIGIDVRQIAGASASDLAADLAADLAGAPGEITRPDIPPTLETAADALDWLGYGDFSVGDNPPALLAHVSDQWDGPALVVTAHGNGIAIAAHKDCDDQSPVRTLSLSGSADHLRMALDTAAAELRVRCGMPARSNRAS